MLGELASGTLVLSHEALDAHPRRRGADYLRHLLVANGVLEPRNDELARLEVWIAAYLQSVENAAERRLLRSYARWRVLRRARRRAEGSDRAARTPTRHAKNCLKAATAFLAFLARRGHDLSGCTQADLDAWLASGPNASNVADFLDWAASARHLERFSVSSHGRQRGQPLDEDSYWACARRLLHDDSCELTDRVAGSLVLLYGQQLSRIVTLRKDQLSIEGGKARLRLGTTPIELPPPLDRLAARLASERRPHSGIGSPATSPWLFTGLDPGRPLSAYQLGQRLRHLGVDPPAARRAALGHLAGQLPAAFLASLLGVTAATAVRWVQAAGGDWNAYAAQIARRQ